MITGTKNHTVLFQIGVVRINYIGMHVLAWTHMFSVLFFGCIICILLYSKSCRVVINNVSNLFVRHSVQV